MNETPVALTARPLVAWLLLLGPVATIAALVAVAAGDPDTLNAAPMWTYLAVALVAWSPLPVSIPAIVLEKDRDLALPGYHGLGRLTRAARLIPHMLTRSPRRVEFAASLVGFLAAAALAWVVWP